MDQQHQQRKPQQQQQQSRGPKPEEKPSRTLFIRNVQYETPEKEIQEMFSKFGEIRKFFNIVAKRGMAFVTYFDIRAAEYAKSTLQNTTFQGRPIDVHFAIPKEEEQKHDEEESTGAICVTIRGATQIPNHENINMYFSKWGNVRDVKDSRNAHNEKFIEYQDIRDADKALKECRGAPFLDGKLEVRWAYLNGLKDKRGNSDDSYVIQSIPQIPQQQSQQQQPQIYINPNVLNSQQQQNLILNAAQQQQGNTGFSFDSATFGNTGLTLSQVSQPTFQNSGNQQQQNLQNSNNSNSYGLSNVPSGQWRIQNPQMEKLLQQYFGMNFFQEWQQQQQQPTQNY